MKPTIFSFLLVTLIILIGERGISSALFFFLSQSSAELVGYKGAKISGGALRKTDFMFFCSAILFVLAIFLSRKHEKLSWVNETTDSFNRFVRRFQDVFPLKVPPFLLASVLFLIITIL